LKYAETSKTQKDIKTYNNCIKQAKEEEKNATSTPAVTIDSTSTSTNTNSVNVGVTASATEGGSFSSTNPDTLLTKYCADRKAIIDNGGLVKYDGGVCDGENDSEGFNKLVTTANSILSWIVTISFLIGAAMAFYAGFLYVSSAYKPDARTQAKNIFINVVVGLIMIYLAWFIVGFILDTFATGESAGVFSGIQDSK